MPDPDQYDAVVIGSGEEGSASPGKNEIWSAGVAHTVSRAAAFGVTTGAFAVDMATC